MKKLLLIFGCTFVLYIAVAALRGGYVTLLWLTGFPLSTLVGLLLLFPLTVFFLKRYGSSIKPVYVLLAILLGVCILELPWRAFHFSQTLISFPDSLAKMAAVLLGFCYYKIKQRKYKITLAVLSLAAYVWMAYFGYNLWLNKLNYGTFLGKVEQVVENPLVTVDASGREVALSDFRGKYVVLDFWSSGCGVCFEKFPLVQKLYEAVQGDERVEVVTVFCTYDRGQGNETIQTGLDMLRKYKYTFPVLAIDGKEPVLDEIGVDGFPTVIIFAPDGKLVFRGSIERAKKYIGELTGR